MPLLLFSLGINGQVYFIEVETQDEMKAAQKKASDQMLMLFVDVYADWCGPCHMLTPVIETLAGDHGRVAKVGKLNVDESPDIAMRYSVMSIPTLLVIDGGDVKKKIVGAKGKGALLQELDEFLATSR